MVCLRGTLQVGTGALPYVASRFPHLIASRVYISILDHTVGTWGALPKMFFIKAQCIGVPNRINLIQRRKQKYVEPVDCTNPDAAVYSPTGARKCRDLQLSEGDLLCHVRFVLRLPVLLS